MNDIVKLSPDYVLSDATNLSFKSKNRTEGVTNEELLKILINHIDTLNNAVPCTENEKTLLHLNKALNWLELRTQTRVSQGVNGQETIHSTNENEHISDVIDIPAHALASIKAATTKAASNAKTSEYMRGMTNGLILALALLDNTEPKYIEKTTIKA